MHNLGSKCNSLTQQFIGISTIGILWGPEDDSIGVAHVAMVVDIPIRYCVRLLHLVPKLLYLTFRDGKHKVQMGNFWKIYCTARYYTAPTCFDAITSSSGSS